MSFGWEYALSRRWSKIQRIYIRLIGVVDLPTRMRARVVLSATAGLTGETIVDFGAGTGVYSYFYSRQLDREVTAVDVDNDRIYEINKIAGELGRDRLIAVAGDERYFTASKRGEVELVVAIEVLQYCRRLEELLRDIRVSLRPGGALVAHVPVRQYLEPYEQHLFTDEFLLELMHRAGFETAKVERTFGPTAQRLCAVFQLLSRRPVLLAVLFPLLLLGASLTPCVSKTGASRLLVAYKARD